jgi:hypothetical protein
VLGLGADLVLDITARHYDVAGYARREHAWGTLTRSETQHLITALVAVLAEAPDLADACDLPVSFPTRRV